MTVVTGGAGFVGSHLVDGLVNAGARVKVVDNLSRSEEGNLAWARAHGDVQVHSADIRDARIWDDLLPGADIVFHQAALRFDRCEEYPRECWEVMVDATLAMLRACVTHRVKKVVAASSAIVYGAADLVPTPENHHLNNNTTWYGTAKITGEQLIRTFGAHDGLAGISLRYFNIYGQRMATRGNTEVLVKWLQALEKKQPVRVFGDGSQTMDWVDVRDVARANLLAAQSTTSSGVMNVGTGRETSLRDLAILVLRAWGEHGEPEILKDAPMTTPIPRRCADTQTAWEHLRFRAEIPLEKGLSDMVRWWKDIRVCA